MASTAITVSDHTRIAFRLEGPSDAPVLMLSNSLGTTMDMWCAQVPALSRCFRVLRYDSRGHGQSSAPAGDYTITRLGQDVVELLDHLGIERASFCGLSMGGMVGQWLGANAAKRLERLVLCNTSAFTGPEGWRNRMATVESGGMQVVADAVVPRWFTAEFCAAQPKVVAELRQRLCEADPQGYTGCCAAIRDMDLRPFAQTIRAPTLVIGGTRDQATPLADSQWLADAIPQAALAILPAAHLSNVECESDFTGLLGVFLMGAGVGKILGDRHSG